MRANAFLRQSYCFDKGFERIEFQGIDIHLLADALDQVAILFGTGGRVQFEVLIRVALHFWIIRRVISSISDFEAVKLRNLHG